MAQEHFSFLVTLIDVVAIDDPIGFVGYWCPTLDESKTPTFGQLGIGQDVTVYMELWSVSFYVLYVLSMGYL